MVSPLGPGPLLRDSENERDRQRMRARVGRYAREWDDAGRPSRLLLCGTNLAWAVDRLDCEGDLDLVFDATEKSYILASLEEREQSKLARVIGIVALGSVLVGALGFAIIDDDDRDPSAAGELIKRAAIVPTVDTVAPEPPLARTTELLHVVIPGETLEEVALRYGVSIQAIALWNGVDESTPLEVGSELTILHARKVPLARQQLVYRPDQRESWSSLARRFDVPVSKLQAFNPEVADDDLVPGVELTIWIDPKPLAHKHAQLPEFEVRPNAISVGAPQNGRLLEAVQFPEDDALYKLRNPHIMWCSSHTAKHLREAIASFRYSYDFNGEIVVADMSMRGGGTFAPHKSHQSGRDVDVWLPTLAGVYQPSHIHEGRERRPNPEEADWFALYGLLAALHETGEVQQVFLDYALHERVYQAAELMGASDEELDSMIAYPRGAHFRGSLLQHSAGHIHHIHVRFKCGPKDQCSSTATAQEAGD